MDTSELKRIAIRELALFTGLLFIGLVVVPVAIYQVGEAVFGTYGGGGYMDFFGRLSEKVRRFDTMAWFLILSPWLGWQCLRLAAYVWRASKPAVG